MRLRTLAAATTLLVATGTLPAVAANDGAVDTDYQQVVDITFPLSADTPVRYSDDYDASRGGGRHHQSTDLMVAGGTPVYAAQAGYVAWRSGSTAGPPSYGWMLRVRGEDGRDYVYVHLGFQDRPIEEAYAEGTAPGQRVERGQLLGWAGCSGSATCGGGEHLHFEIHDPNVVDPYDHHDHERINPYPSLVDAEARGDYAGVQLPRPTFDDVEPGSTHHADIEALAESGITRGCAERRFCPSRAVTRQQMASFLVRALDLPPVEDPSGDEEPTEEGSSTALHRFADVAEENLHGDDIAALAAAGITRGCGTDTFCPSAPVTRQQMASFLVRALDLPPAEDPGSFTDVEDGNVHAADIAALAAAGITRGCGADRFCPDAPVTREQMASFLVRALGR